MLNIDIRKKAYGDTIVLRDIDFQISAGECLALLGPSGVGKTTMLNIVAGLDHDFTGQITTRGKIAMVFQEPTLLDWRNALENLTLITKICEHEALHLLQKVGLENKEKHFPRQLSLGQRRRLAIARAFAINPDVLIMDEPFASLDRAIAYDLIDMVKSLMSEKPMACLFVTHAKDEADRLATRTLTLESNSHPTSLK